ncbi:hypothetical protein I5Q82_04615 [Acutalibacter muris]|uniref:Uncharacterized protein n=1 Tax=Acutalibacter muris TaxID=1796620 RepID=A0A1Z2XTG9_9FIRM|nr:hypothetical protein [Acutalibacter muris]ANU55046.1 hypothetical protein A4V00_14090 [Hungateiclostridiaceae bacterium KB18]ASB41720.1 hypothetical protein ADH66_14245 [Acutalibacter muris]QQR30985.1 hypothetical protein I5Q82_04615 [Acutalibacter muris]
MLLDTWSFVRYIFTDLIGFCYFVLPVLLTFGVQLLLCFKAKRVIFKLLPLFLGPLIVGASYTSLFAVRHDVGFEVLLAMGIGLLILLGSVLAWLVYGGIRGVSGMLSNKSSRPNL